MGIELYPKSLSLAETRCYQPVSQLLPNVPKKPKNDFPPSIPISTALVLGVNGFVVMLSVLPAFLFVDALCLVLLSILVAQSFVPERQPNGVNPIVRKLKIN